MSSRCPLRIYTAICSDVVDLRLAQGNRTVHRTLLLEIALCSLLSEDVQQRLLSRRVDVSATLSLLLNRLLLNRETALSLRRLAPRVVLRSLLREPLGLLELRLLCLGELLLLLRESLSLLRLLELRLLDRLLELRLLNRLLVLRLLLCRWVLVRLSLTGLLGLLVHRELRAGVLRAVELGCAELTLFERCVPDVRDLQCATDFQSLCAGIANRVSDGSLLLARGVDATEAVVVGVLRVALLSLDRDDQLPLGLIVLGPELQFLGLRVSLLDH